MDFEPVRRVSVCLSMILESMESIGTEEVVLFRRNHNEIINYAAHHTDDYTFIYSGSKGEGYDFSTSDEDHMWASKCTLILNSPADININDRPYKTKVLMRRENCNPGFVILQLLNRTRDRAIRNSTVMYDDIRVVSSLLYRDWWGSFIHGFQATGHGPCSSGTIGDVEFDVAFCFECKLWPTEAYDFITRYRQYQWPAKQLLDRIVERGCHLVAIGDKDSDISHIQWRISFSLAEKSLMYSLNHTQFKVYGLLKIFLKQAIDKIERVKGVLCSYFLKTALFYSIESTPASFWRDDLIIFCFWLCFNKLYSWVMQEYCPNYFVPGNNMFRNKVCGETQRNIASVLYQYKCIGWTCLCQCDNFKILQHVFENPNHIFEKNLKGFTEMASAVLLAKSGHQASLREVKKRLPCFLRKMSQAPSRQADDISTYFVSLLFRDSGSVFYSEEYNTLTRISNKDLYARARKSEIFLLYRSDVCQGFLNLASSYYTTGQYRKAICACKTMVSQWKPYVIYHPNYNTDEIIKFLGPVMDKLLDQKISYIVSKVFAFPVQITASTKHIYPLELKYDIEVLLEISQYLLLLPPLPYSAFLSFLCHHKLGNIGNSLSALHDLKILVNDKIQGRYYIVYNMLAICLEKLGDICGAMDACLQSIQIKPNENGAFRLIDKIISSG